MFIALLTPAEKGISISFILSALLLIFGSSLFTFGAELSLELIGNKIGKSLVKSKKVWSLPNFFIVLIKSPLFYLVQHVIIKYN